MKLYSILLFSLFSIQAQEYVISTSKGNIAVCDSQGAGPTVLLIHGNSASGKIFKKQFDALGKKYRLIAPDLLGHGKSGSAKSNDTYSFPGYAKALTELINKMNLNKISLIGWSLGGHIALEMVKMNPAIKGVLITGTPPIQLSQEGFKKGFKPFEGLHLLGHPDQFTDDQAKLFMGLGGINMDAEDTQFILQDAIKARGEARKYMFQAMGNGIGADETEIVRTMDTPLAIIAGENDCGINNDYIANGVKYNTLWKDKVQTIKNAGHAVFWENADEFNKITQQFLDDVWQ